MVSVMVSVMVIKLTSYLWGSALLTPRINGKLVNLNPSRTWDC